jgi:hypothetical protein
MIKLQITNSKVQTGSKFKICNLVIVWILVSCYLVITPTTFAATPTASPSADLKTKLQALQAGIASKAAQIKADISKKLQNRAYVGYIKSKSETSITIAAKSGTKIITVNQDTLFSGKTKTTLKSLNNDDYVVGLGDIDDTGVLTARKVIKLGSPTQTAVQTVWGQVVGISDTEVTITTKEGKTITVSFGKNTDFKYGEEESSVNDVRMNKGIIAVGSSPKSGYINARLVYIQPYSSSYTPKAITPSPVKATPTASPSATAQPKKR